MKFTKMQGAGNDYGYVNCVDQPLENPSAVARQISDRHYGIGSDGLILICPSDVADFRMVMYNADGSQAQMCGNGIRCVGKYVHDRGLTDQTSITIETLGGVKSLTLHLRENTVAAVTVDMGPPTLAPAMIPVLWEKERMVDQAVTVNGQIHYLTAISMGNPHAVIFVSDVDSLNLPEIGPLFENHSLFPQRTNTEFVQIISPTLLKMRVWERGAGETLACGTGACASLVAAVLCGKAKPEATLQLLGGDLQIRWDLESGHVFMTGPAEFVFDGEINI